MITGGVGFIGYHITKELLGLGIEVILYDAFLNYIPPLESRYPQYLEYRLKNLENKAQIIRGDIRDRGISISIPVLHRPEEVIITCSPT